MPNKSSSTRSTITQVAKHAGVTIGTVSHVINGTAPISKETTERVNASIKELNYIPNIMARSLRSRKSRLIGILIPNLKNSFHSTVTSAFVDKAYKEGYTVLIMGYEYSLERERIELERLENSNVSTIVIFNGYGDEEYISSLKKKGISVVLADRKTALPNIPFVQYDNKKIMFDILSMLKKKGYQSIGFLSEPIKLTNLQDRYDAYLAAMKQSDYEIKPEHVFIEDNLCLDNLQNGYQYMKKILDTHTRGELPDVLIASSDLLAIGIMRAITEYGYEIPKDFGLIGFDNTEISGYVNPRLTTVNQNQVLLGEKLWEIVKNVVDGKELIENITLEQTLIVRTSC